MKSKTSTLWLTGLSGSGKSTFAIAFKEYCELSHIPVVILDGDVLRKGLCSDLGFSFSDRLENNRRAAEIAKLLNQSGINVVAALISPLKSSREVARKIIGSEYFYEVYLNAPLSLCEYRDPKGLYRKARNNEILEFTGISAPYDIPENPDIVLDYQLGVDSAVNKVIEKLKL